MCAQVGDRALAQADPKAALRAVMKSWLPLSEAVLGMAVEQLPDPVAAAPERLPRLLALDAMADVESSLSASVQQVGLVGSCRLLWQQCLQQLRHLIYTLLAKLQIKSAPPYCGMPCGGLCMQFRACRACCSLCEPDCKALRARINKDSTSPGHAWCSMRGIGVMEMPC